MKRYVDRYTHILFVDCASLIWGYFYIISLGQDEDPRIVTKRVQTSSLVSHLGRYIFV